MDITDIHRIFSIQGVFSFQEDNDGIRGEVIVGLGDVVGEVVANLVKRTQLVMTSCISCDIVDISSHESSGRYN